MTKTIWVQAKKNNVNVNKAPGSDGLHSRVLKELSLNISLTLSIIFTDSLLTAIVPGRRHTAVNKGEDCPKRVSVFLNHTFDVFTPCAC